MEDQAHDKLPNQVVVEHIPAADVPASNSFLFRSDAGNSRIVHRDDSSEEILPYRCAGVMELEFRYPENAFLQSPLPDSQRDTLQLPRIACHHCCDGDESRRRFAKSEVPGLINKHKASVHGDESECHKKSVRITGRLFDLNGSRGLPYDLRGIALNKSSVVYIGGSVGGQLTLFSTLS